MDIEQILDKIYPLSESSKLILKNHIVELSFPKNKILISTDKIEKTFILSKKELHEHLFIPTATKLHFLSEKKVILLYL